MTQREPRTLSRKSISFCTAALVFLASLLQAQEPERRLALVIGNSTYEKISPLRNPVNDGEDVSTALTRLGFNVVTLLNGTKREMFAAVRKFGEDLRRYDVGVFYYAGHGLQFEGKNFLVAVDADIRRETDIPFESTDLTRILAEMEGAGSRVNIVILDACRNNPYASRLRSVDRGLSVVKAPTGSLIIYATAPGDVAVDGSGRNGTFTEAFLKHLENPGVDVEVLLKDVRRDVQIATDGRQIPWTTSSLTTGFYFKPPAATSPPVAATPPPPSVTPPPPAPTPPADTGTLAIAGLPSEVRVTLDGMDVTGQLRELPETGERLLDKVPVGTKMLVFEGPYMARTEVSAMVGPNRTTRVEPSLMVLGGLRLAVSPVPQLAFPEAVVTLRNFEGPRQGRFRVTEGFAAALPPGPYQVTVSFANDTASGYEGVTLIEEGRETVLTLQLDYSTPYKLSGLNARRAALKTDLAAVQQRKKNHEIGAGFTIGIGLISGVVAGVLYSQGSVAMDNYLGATGAADAARYREMTEDYSRAFTATAIGSGIFLGIGALSLLSLPDARPLEREIELLDRSIKRLSEGTK